MTSFPRVVVGGAKSFLCATDPTQLTTKKQGITSVHSWCLSSPAVRVRNARTLSVQRRVRSEFVCWSAIHRGSNARSWSLFVFRSIAALLHCNSRVKSAMERQ